MNKLRAGFQAGRSENKTRATMELPWHVTCIRDFSQRQGNCYPVSGFVSKWHRIAHDRINLRESLLINHFDYLTTGRNKFGLFGARGKT